MTIEEAIPKVFGVINAIKKAKSEESPGGSKITLVEKIGLGLKGLTLVQVVSAYKQLAEDWKSRDTAKKQVWKDTFAAEFDLEDDELEAAIENAVDAILNFESAFLSFGEK